MIYKIVIISLLSFLSLPSDWQIYENRKAGFNVLVPHKIQMKEKIVSTGMGDVLITTCFTESNVDSTENFLYIINFYPVDTTIFSNDTAELNWTYLDNSMRDITNGLSGKIMYSNREFIKSYPVLTYRVVYGESKNQLKAKLILTEEYFFSLQVFSTENYALNKNMDKFLNSFNLL